MLENIDISFRNNDTSKVEGGLGTSQLNNNGNFKRIHVENRRERLTIGGSEFLFLVGNRLYYSKGYKVFYFSMIVLNVLILLYLLLVRPGAAGQTSLFFAFEILITFLLAIEVGIKLLAQNKSYWSRPTNWFDFFVLMLCVASLVIFSRAEFSEAEHVDELMATFLLSVRYIAQALRLIVLLKHKQRLTELTAGIGKNTVDDVDFTLIDPDLDIDEFVGTPRRDSTLSRSSSTSESKGKRVSLGFGYINSHVFSFPKLIRHDSNYSNSSVESYETP